MANDRAGLMDRNEQAMGGPPTDHDIQLTANLSGQRVVVTGNGSASLPAKSGSHRFNFTLTDNTNLSVSFLSLDAQDNCSTCPPQTGENSQQIVAVSMNGASAAFTDNNSGGPMAVCYQWNFTCSDPSKLPIKYDPILNNGGSN